MQKFAEISVILGIFFGIQPASAIPTEALAQTSNQMIELLNAWGFSTTECQPDAVNIKHDVTGEIGCALPNDWLEAGKFIYNSEDNTISPVTTESASQPQPETSTATQPNTEATPSESNIEKVVFDFNNSYDYGACLDAILLAYEERNVELEKVSKNECATKVLEVYGNNISKDTALQLIKSADYHATEVLEDKLYPSLGIRRRVAINLGYVYDIDKNNNDILKYVTSKEN